MWAFVIAVSIVVGGQPQKFNITNKQRFSYDACMKAASQIRDVVLLSVSQQYSPTATFDCDYVETRPS